VDATGDGDLCAWAGAPFEKGDADGAMMPGTLCQLWADAHPEEFRKTGRSHNCAIEQAYADGVFDYCDKHLPGIWYIEPGIGGGNVGHTFGVDSTDERSLTEALVTGRKLARQYERYYKEYLRTGFEKMKLVATGSLLGIRESRRIMGDYVMCLDDFKNRATFPDEIGRYSYPVDIHVTRPNDEAEYERFAKEFAEMRYGKGESYGIPYRSLVPRELTNVLVAGRCLSADRSMQGSVRVMPGCYITGQAAGMAAALAIEADTDTRGVDVPTLQQRLKAVGAFLPNA